MCLRLRWDGKDVIPYNKKDTRWKVVSISCNDGHLYGPYQHFRYHKRHWNISKDVNCLTLSGFHVFVNREDARFLCKELNSYNAVYGKNVVKKVKVRKFKRSGEFDNSRSETWGQMKFVK